MPDLRREGGAKVGKSRQKSNTGPDGILTDAKGCCPGSEDNEVTHGCVPRAFLEGNRAARGLRQTSMVGASWNGNRELWSEMEFA